jgi:carboxymethylenebutenolidase
MGGPEPVEGQATDWSNALSERSESKGSHHLERSLMYRMKAGDFDQELLNLFDQYVHGQIDRRGFLDRATKFAIGGMTAPMLLEALSPRFAEAQQVKKDDPRLKTQTLEYPSPQGSGTMKGYFALPANVKGKLPGVLVVHENRGLNPHIEDIARRLALENFVAFAPDALTPLGGYPGDEDSARGLFPKLDQTKTREDFVAAVAVLKARPECTGKVGAVGFCYGGAIANMLASRVPDLAAAVPFYGMQPSAEEAAKIKAPLLIHYAENDQRVNAGWPAYEEALKANKVNYTMHQYPGTQHGFNNDTTPRYDEAAAKLAWQRTVDFFNKNVRG